MFIEAVRGWRASKGWLTTLTDPAKWLFYGLYGGGETSAGVLVGARTALENPPALRAIRLISESLSSVPINLMEQAEGTRKKTVLRDEDKHWLVHAEPNEMMSSAIWRQVMQLHVLTHGNGYTFIERNAATGRPVALLPLPPDTTHATLEKGRFFYETQGINGERIELQPRDVVHVPWVSWDGIRGESPSLIGKRTIALGIAARESVSKFFAQGMQQGGVIEQPAGQGMGETSLKTLKAAIEAKYSGLSNAWRPWILEPGLIWKQTSVNPDSAQATELMEMNVADAARTYGVPLHLLDSLQTGAQSYASVEQFGLIYVRHTMLPWFFVWEQEFNRKLLAREERRTRFFKFNMEGLLRGDKASRATANEIELRGGALTVNEWRELEDRDPSIIAEADEPLILSSQLAPLSQVGRPVEPHMAPAAPVRGMEMLERLYGQQARRCVRQLTDSGARIAEKFKDNRGRFDAEMHDAVSRIADDFTDVFDRRHFDFFERQMREAPDTATVIQFWKSMGTQLLSGRTQ